MAEQIATQEWYTRALVRIREQRVCHSPEGGEHTFYVGEEVYMVQWGRAGRPVDRSAWWTSFDIDGAFIIEADKVEVIKIIDEVSPL